MRAVLLGLLLSFAGAGCGGATEDGGLGVSSGRPDRRPVELELRTPEGAFVYIGDLRGKMALLFLFATFDGVSQAALVPLRRFLRHNPGVEVVGIAVQPDAEMLVDAWDAALDPPFAVTFDPNGVIIEGTSDLGPVESVPTYVLLDERGMPVARHVGFASERRLDRLLAEAAGD